MTQTERDEYLRQIVRQFRASGLTRTAFYRANGVAHRTLTTIRLN